jgi:hypothetical protein
VHRILGPGIHALDGLTAEAAGEVARVVRCPAGFLGGTPVPGGLSGIACGKFIMNTGDLLFRPGELGGGSRKPHAQCLGALDRWQLGCPARGKLVIAQHTLARGRLPVGLCLLTAGPCVLAA